MILRVRFFLGTHQPNWLADERFSAAPLFVSRRRLNMYASPPPGVCDFALDSGGFTELQLYGRWATDAATYAAEVLRYAKFYGGRLSWAAPQDWMCEPIVIAGGAGAHGVMFAGTGLSVEEHQRRTVDNFVELRGLLGGLVILVLQGWALADYGKCQQMYADAGVSLEDERVVGVGSVCRRQATAEVTTIMTTLASDGLQLHGFGFKKLGLRNVHELLESADSMAWSAVARQEGICLPGHDQPGPGRPRGHRNCANCAEWALMWRDQLLSSLEVGRAA